MSDLFYGSPPPRFTEHVKTVEHMADGVLDYDPNSVKTPGYVGTSPEHMDLDYDNIDLEYEEEERYNASKTPFDDPEFHFMSAKTPGVFHNNDDVLTAKTPGYYGAGTTYMRDNDEDDDGFTGARTPGMVGHAVEYSDVDNIKHVRHGLGATTPYHFGGSPGPEFPDVQNAESIRAEIYERMAAERATDSRRRENERLHSSRTPSFATAAAMIRTPTHDGDYDDVFDSAGLGRANYHAALVENSGDGILPNAASNVPYINPNDPRRNRHKALSITDPALVNRDLVAMTSRSTIDDGASTYDNMVIDGKLVPETEDDPALEGVSMIASIASIDAPAPILRTNTKKSRSKGPANPFKMPNRPASAYTTPGSGRKTKAGNHMPTSATSGQSTPGHFSFGGSVTGGLTPGGRVRNKPATNLATDRPGNDSEQEDNDQAEPTSTGPTSSTARSHKNTARTTNKRKRAASASGATGSSPTPAPKKRASKQPLVEVPKTPRTPRALKTPKERIRAPPRSGKAVDNKLIPRSFAECDEADKLLITMRDAGEPWAPIKAKYSELSGDNYGHSTLPNRYERLKANFITIREEDNILIVEAKKEIEEEFDLAKWASIADRVNKKGGGVYDGLTLQRQYKKLMQNQGFNVRDGMARQDVDFAGDDTEEDEDQE